MKEVHNAVIVWASKGPDRKWDLYHAYLDDVIDNGMNPGDYEDEVITLDKESDIEPWIKENIRDPNIDYVIDMKLVFVEHGSIVYIVSRGEQNDIRDNK